MSLIKHAKSLSILGRLFQLLKLALRQMDLLYNHQIIHPKT
ncbi:MAG: hypothetical protein RB289_07130 [Paludibacter sp.]|nr:hypothetical protein [Paludibacter sp.]